MHIEIDFGRQDASVNSKNCAKNKRLLQENHFAVNFGRQFVSVKIKIFANKKKKNVI